MTSMIGVLLNDIFLDIKKAHENLDRDWCLNILTGYGVVPRAIRILQTYWGWITMIEKAI